MKTTKADTSRRAHVVIACPCRLESVWLHSEPIRRLNRAIRLPNDEVCRSAGSVGVSRRYLPVLARLLSEMEGFCLLYGSLKTSTKKTFVGETVAAFGRSHQSGHP